ncbi:MAG: nucleotide sugar dehydrogenase [Pseudomonadales bacterium]
MRISVFGLGYVGVVAAAALANDGHHVIGVDPNAVKVDLIRRGKSPIIEAGVETLIGEAVRSGSLCATQDARQAILDTELSLVCVGTPSRSNGSLDLAYVERVCEEVGAALADKDTYHVVAIRSTVLPGTMAGTVIPTLERKSGKDAGVAFGVCHNPEFLREGSAVQDYRHPPKTVIGQFDTRSGEALERIYGDLEAPLFRVPIQVAEMVKYADNVWHAIKVCFANEIGTICKAQNIDSHEVMGIFCEDRKLNISPTYLKPGFAFGGSCLPKDVRALCYMGQSLDLSLPLLSSVLPSNREQVDRALDLIQRSGCRRIAVLGFSFKAGTDDLRESPMVEVIERLLGKGHQIRIFDHNVNLAKLVGSNRDYILNQIPHISNLMVDTIEAAIDDAEVVVIGNSATEFEAIVDRVPESTRVIDLVRIPGRHVDRRNYDGICW